MITGNALSIDFVTKYISLRNCAKYGVCNQQIMRT